MAEHAVVTGTVEYRAGDGANIVIRPGKVKVQSTQTDVTLSWVEGKTHGAAAMPVGDFRAYVAKGLIALRKG